MQQDTECNAAKTFFWWRLNLKAEKLKKHTFRYGFKRSDIQILEMYNLCKVIKKGVLNLKTHLYYSYHHARICENLSFGFPAQTA